MRYLIKIGSALISKDNTIDLHWLSKKISEMSLLHTEGHQIIVITSGAVAAGMETRGLTKRPNDPLQLQLLSGQGQVKLIKYYKDLFMEKKIYISQILLTHHNFINNKETETIGAIIDIYLQDGVVPIINENDMVNKEELDGPKFFTDNDILAALVAINNKVDQAIILTDVDGVYDGDPKSDNNIEFIPRVNKIDDNILAMTRNGKSDLGLGGMSSKIKAAKMITEAGIETIIANGKYQIRDIISGKVPRTVFPAQKAL